MAKEAVSALSFLPQTSVHAADKIRIGYPSASADHIILPLAQEKGFFKEEGVDAEIISIMSRGSVATLINGEID